MTLDNPLIFGYRQSIYQNEEVIDYPQSTADRITSLRYFARILYHSVISQGPCNDISPLLSIETIEDNDIPFFSLGHLRTSNQKADIPLCPGGCKINIHLSQHDTLYDVLSGFLLTGTEGISALEPAPDGFTVNKNRLFTRTSVIRTIGTMITLLGIIKSSTGLSNAFSFLNLFKVTDWNDINAREQITKRYIAVMKILYELSTAFRLYLAINYSERGFQKLDTIIKTDSTVSSINTFITMYGKLRHNTIKKYYPEYIIQKPGSDTNILNGDNSDWIKAKSTLLSIFKFGALNLKTTGLSETEFELIKNHWNIFTNPYNFIDSMIYPRGAISTSTDNIFDTVLNLFFYNRESMIAALISRPEYNKKWNARFPELFIHRPVVYTDIEFNKSNLLMEFDNDTGKDILSSIKIPEIKCFLNIGSNWANHISILRPDPANKRDPFFPNFGNKLWYYHSTPKNDVFKIGELQWSMTEVDAVSETESLYNTDNFKDFMNRLVELYLPNDPDKNTITSFICNILHQLSRLDILDIINTPNKILDNANDSILSILEGSVTTASIINQFDFDNAWLQFTESNINDTILKMSSVFKDWIWATIEFGRRYRVFKG